MQKQGWISSFGLARERLLSMGMTYVLNTYFSVSYYFCNFYNLLRDTSREIL